MRTPFSISKYVSICLAFVMAALSMLPHYGHNLPVQMIQACLPLFRASNSVWIC